MSAQPVEILIATANPGKAREIAAVLSAPDADSPGSAPAIRWRSLSDWPAPIPEPHEDGETFLDNAILKARYYSKATGLWTLADDSGLEVDALDGAPGVHSARFAGEGRSREERDAANNLKLIALLRDIPLEKRTARYRCVLALARGDDILATTEGTLEGLIIDEPRGAGGFGYDPYFLLSDLGRTTAEISAEHKNRISHRGLALQSMKRALAGLLARRTADE